MTPPEFKLSYKVDGGKTIAPINTKPVSEKSFIFPAKLKQRIVVVNHSLF